MAYYLTDPYYYLPKCYPFIGRQWTTPRLQAQNRITSLGRQIQDFSATQRLDYTSKAFCDSAQCEENLMRCRYKLREIQNPEQMAHVLTNRKQKQECLRKKAHKFPAFVRSESLMKQIMQKKKN